MFWIALIGTLIGAATTILDATGNAQARKKYAEEIENLSVLKNKASKRINLTNQEIQKIMNIANDLSMAKQFVDPRIADKVSNAIAKAQNKIDSYTADIANVSNVIDNAQAKVGNQAYGIAGLGAKAQNFDDQIKKLEIPIGELK